MITKTLCLAIIITNEPGRCNSEMMGFLNKINGSKFPK
jgi:hypothetical protein